MRVIVALPLELAFHVRMQRKKGQFTSSKSVSEEVGSSSSDYNPMSGQEEQETS